MADRKLIQVENVFQAALDLPAEERAAYLAQACAGNESLYAEVCSLVSAADTHDSFMDKPILNLGFEVLTKSDDEAMIGRMIGSYKILSRLGKGGMGQVYLAEDTVLDRKVALKFLSQELVNDNWAKRQLVREAQAVAQLDHPNICSVYGFEYSGDQTFIVMQFIEGETLADLIHNNRVSQERVLDLTQQIGLALAEAHAHGVIHRDIKSRNIMVTPEGQVKVLDFGLAKTIQQKDGREFDKSTSYLAQNGILAGTVAYMSPEQLRGDRLDFRTDIFSLGTVLYELIEGENPFVRTSEAETISAILTSDPPPTRHANGLDRVVRRCLAKDRDSRYQSISEVLLDLESNTTRDLDDRFTPSIHFWKFGIIALVLIAIGLTAFYFRDRLSVIASKEVPATNGAIKKTHKFSLAVIPMTSDSPDWNSEFISEGLTDSLIKKLSVLSDLHVLPYSSVSGYKDRTKDPVSLGTTLQVNAVLLNHVSRRDTRDVLESRLIRTDDGSTLWTGETAIGWQTMLSLEDQVTKKVIESIEARVVNENEFLENYGTRSPEAFRHYMMGRHFWKNRDLQNINKAIDEFKFALKLDPIYARAFAGLADSYVLLSTVTFGKSPTDESMQQARSAALEALKNNPNLPEAHTALGVVKLRYEWKWQEAESLFQKALTLDPDYAPAHYWYSHLLLILGRNDEAIAESRKAKELDPFSPPSVMNYCRVLMNAGSYDAGATCYDNVLKENPDNKHAQYLRALINQRSGRPAEALRVFERLYKEDRALAGAALGYAYAKAGRTTEARQILAEMQELAKQRYVPQQEFAIIYIGLGDYDNAFAALEKAYEDRFAGLIYLRLEPIFSSLRSDPRFESLAKRMDLPPRPAEP